MGAQEDLETRRDAICAELAALDTDAAGGIPNATGGTKVDHVGYRLSLYQELASINDLLASGSIMGAFEVTSEGLS